MSVESVGGTVVLHLPAEGRPIASEQDALDLVGALRDVVRESNRGHHVWFLAGGAELTARLTR